MSIKKINNSKFDNSKFEKISVKFDKGDTVLLINGKADNGFYTITEEGPILLFIKIMGH